MPVNLTVKKMHEAVRLGFRRMENFRNARLMFLRNFVGQYYDKYRGSVGTEPMNLIFNAIRILVPNLVMSPPQHVVRSRFVLYREYGELLGMALDYNAKDQRLRDTLRRWIIDSLFCMGILKTGLCESSQAICFDDSDEIDPGEIYTEIVDLDNFTFDPSTLNSMKEAAWIGDKIRVPRQQLLDSGRYRNDLVEQLAIAGTDFNDGSEKLSAKNLPGNEINEIHDYVDIVEIWVPGANALVTLPASDQSFDDYLRIADYRGPKEGPYTFLQLTPPVPGNPVPISAVGIWNDIHVRANQMATKIITQAESQKSVLGYKRGSADDAQEILDAEDGSYIGLDNPGEAKMLDFGGQQRSNEAHLQQLMMWFNMMSGNTEALGGFREQSATATQAQMLQMNQAIGIQDWKELVYEGVAEEAGKRAWYLHTDPLIEVPLIRRRQKSAKTIQGEDGQSYFEPAEIVEEQVILTPEMRRGDFLDFHFEIQPKSMGRLDPQMRLQRAMEFAIKLVPAAATAAQICMQMGIAFSFPRFLIRMAKEAGIEWMDEVFFDPDFQMQMAEMMMKAPAFQGSQSEGRNAGSPGAIQQNGQPANVAQVQGITPNLNKTAQTGANAGQSNLMNNERY